MPFHRRDPAFAHNDCRPQGAEYETAGLFLVVLVISLHPRGGITGARDEFGRDDDVSRSTLGLALLAFALAVIVARLPRSFVDFYFRLMASGIPIVFWLSVLAGSAALRMRWVDPEVRWTAADCDVMIIVFAPSVGWGARVLEKGH